MSKKRDDFLVGLPQEGKTPVHPESEADETPRPKSSRKKSTGEMVAQIKWKPGDKPAMSHPCVKRIALLEGILKVSFEVHDYVNNIVFTMLHQIVAKADLYRSNNEKKRITIANIQQALERLKIGLYKEQYSILYESQKARSKRASKKKGGEQSAQESTSEGSDSEGPSERAAPRRTAGAAKRAEKKRIKTILKAFGSGEYYKIVRGSVVEKMLKGVMEVIRVDRAAGEDNYQHFLPLSRPIVDYFTVIIVECTRKLFARAFTYAKASNRVVLKLRDVLAALVADQDSPNPCYPVNPTLDRSFDNNGLQELQGFDSADRDVNRGVDEMTKGAKILRSVRVLTVQKKNAR